MLNFRKLENDFFPFSQLKLNHLIMTLPSQFLLTLWEQPLSIPTVLWY
jgi:hypothetical protein